MRMLTRVRRKLKAFRPHDLKSPFELPSYEAEAVHNRVTSNSKEIKHD